MKDRVMKQQPLLSLLTATALSVSAASLAQAQSVEELKAQPEALSKGIEELEKNQANTEKPKAPAVKKPEPAFALSTSDGLFEFNVRSRIYADAGWGKDDDGTMEYDSTEFRTARLGIEGKAWKDVKYKFAADFADNAVALKNVFLQYGSWKFGQFKTPNSLEEQTSSQHTTFMERASFTDAFGLAHMLGIGYDTKSDNWTVSAGLFRGTASSSSSDEGEVIAARATYGGKLSDGAWMLGASARVRNVGDADELRYRQRPHNHLSDRFVATGYLTDRDTMFGAELALQKGPLHFASEYATLKADSAGSNGDATFDGGYFEASWFITGESKLLKLSSGAWDHLKVKKPLHKGGFGAWQIAAKYDFIDLTDNGVFGGEQETWILGLNWYQNQHTRLMANYSHSKIEDAFDVAANGDDGKNSVDTLGVRFQIDW